MALILSTTTFKWEWQSPFLIDPLPFLGYIYLQFLLNSISSVIPHIFDYNLLLEK